MLDCQMKYFVTYSFEMKLKRYFLPKNEFIETKEKKRLLKTHFEISALKCTEIWIGPVASGQDLINYNMKLCIKSKVYNHELKTRLY